MGGIDTHETGWHHKDTITVAAAQTALGDATRACAVADKWTMASKILGSCALYASTQTRPVQPFVFQWTPQPMVAVLAPIFGYHQSQWKEQLSNLQGWQKRGNASGKA